MPVRGVLGLVFIIVNTSLNQWENLTVMIRCARQNVAEFKRFQFKQIYQRVTKMKATSYSNSKSPAGSDIFEQLDREFDSGRFYGLEYIVEELKIEKTRDYSADNSFDWHGLNDLTRM